MFRYAAKKLVVIFLFLCVSCTTQYRTKEFADNKKNVLNFKKYDTKALDTALLPPKPQEKKANVSVKDINLNSLCRLLSLTFNKPLVPDNKTPSTLKISLDLKHVSLRDVLDHLRYQYNIGYEKVGNTLVMNPGGIKTKTFYVRYHGLDRKSVSTTNVNAFNKNERNSSRNSYSNTTNISNIETKSETKFWTDLASGIKNIIAVSGMENVPQNSVEVLSDAGMILVTADPRTMHTVSQFIDKINRKSSQQVIVEVKILEIQLNDDFRNGLRMELLGKKGGGSYGIATSPPGLDSTRASRLAGLRDFGSFSGGSNIPSLFKALYLSGDFTSIIEALSSQGKVSVLSSPTLNILNNHRGVIKYGTDKKFLADINNITFNNASGAQTQSGYSFETYFDGIALDTTPNIQEDGQVIMHIKPIINRVKPESVDIVVEGKTTSVTLASVDSRETDTMISAQSGSIIIIGGITEDMVSLNTAGPLPSDDSLMSKIFSPVKGQNSAVTKKEIMILIKPTIIDNIKHDIL